MASLTDPFMLAALRQRQAVRPLGGRREGGLSTLAGRVRDGLGTALSDLAASPVGTMLSDLATLPQRALTAAGHLHRTGEYDPAPATDIAMMMVGAPLTPRGALGSSAGKPPLPSDRASRHARAAEQGYSPGYWRGEASGAAPDRYSDGAYFSLDKAVAAGFGKRGGVEPRPFWLKLDKVFHDTEPLTAAKYARIVRAAREINPKLAGDLAEQIAPGMGVDWVIGFGRARPNFEIPIGSALVRRSVEHGGRYPAEILQRAGFTGVHSGRDVRMFGGKGIRHDDAMFDPAKAKRFGIYLGLGGAAVGPALIENR